MSHVMRKPIFCVYMQTKAHISCEVNRATDEHRYFPYIVPPYHKSESHLLWLYIWVCVGPGGNHEDRFCRNAAQNSTYFCDR